MAYETGSIKGRIITQKTPAIVQGEDAYMVVQLYYAGTDKPYSFNQPATGATAFFPAASGTGAIAASGAIASLPEYAGQLRFELAQADTSAILAGLGQNLQVNFEDQYGLTIILLEGVLNVAEPYY